MELTIGVMEKRRIMWLDALRVLSALAIVIIHTATSIFDYLSYSGFNWFGADAYLAIARYAVPVFVMISGVFFLNPEKDITIKNIYGKYIFRMLCVLIGWSLIRTFIIDIWLGAAPAWGWGASFWTSIKMFWFLPMIIGLYIITPILRAMTMLKNRKLLEYFMIICFVLALCLPALQGILPKASVLTDFTTLLKLPMPIFCVHFMFGYYVYNYELSNRTKIIFYAAALVSVLLMTAGTYFSFDDKTSKIFFYSTYGASLSPLAFLLGAGVFIFCKDFLGKIKYNTGLSSFINRLAYYSLGVYLLHIIIVEIIAHFLLFKYLDFCSVIIIPLAALIIFGAANVIIALLWHFKLARKYLL